MSVTDWFIQYTIAYWALIFAVIAAWLVFYVACFVVVAVWFVIEQIANAIWKKPHKSSMSSKGVKA